ncbi:hypothetical protein KPB2_5545 [Klebsiella pneumoniae Kb677]|nr:hypothetical protein KPB2_5545 [Klebsiella pneumoniae Kb677]
MKTRRKSRSAITWSGTASSSSRNRGRGGRATSLCNSWASTTHKVCATK